MPLKSEAHEREGVATSAETNRRVQHDRRSGWTALAMVLGILLLPTGLALAGRIAPSRSQRIARYEARRAERLGLPVLDGGQHPVSASELLARAAAVAARSKRAPEERAVALRNAAWQLWAEVVRLGRSPEIAEAHFRAAQLRRSDGQVTEALQGYLAVRRADPDGVLVPRAMLAASALMRLEGHWDGALTLLDELAFERSPISKPHTSRARVTRSSLVRDRARYERARTLQQAGRLEAARIAFRQLAEESEHALLAVSSFDGWSRVLVQEGDLEGAAGVLEAAREKFRRRSFERTETGNRLRRALQNMICIPRLERAVAQRQAQHGTKFDRAHKAKDALRDTVRGDF